MTSNDDSPDGVSFWYLPRANVSRDGRWVLFTSNWEKTLGTDPKAAAGERARQDVFLLQLPPAASGDESAPDPPIEISTAALPLGRLKVAYAATLQASREATWMITSGTLPPGLSLSPAGQITGTPRTTGAWSFELTAADPSSFASRTFAIVVNK